MNIQIMAKLAEQLKPLETELTTYRAVFLALKAASPALFGSGGGYDLDQIFALAAASSAVQTRMKQRSEEVSALIEKATSEKEMNLLQLKQPIGFKLPSQE
jgi:hypothetical protein